MDWLAFITNIFSRVPFEKVLFPPRDNTKALEDFATTISNTESSKAAPILEKPTATITRPTPRPELPTEEEVTDELRRRLAMELYKAEADLAAKLRIAGKPCDCLIVRHPLKLAALADEIITKEPDNPVYYEIIQWLKDIQPKTSVEGILSGLHDNEYPKMGAQASKFAKRVYGTTAFTALAGAEPPITLDEAKKLAAEEAEKEVEARWH